MNIPIVFAFVVLQCTLCLSIRVPVDWSDESEVNKNEQSINPTKNGDNQQKPVSSEYFQYTAKKPQFIIDVAATHGVQSPQDHYKSHAIIPHTGLPTSVLGKHRIQDIQKNTYRPNHSFVQNSAGSTYARPASTSYEVFHPYKSEEPALQEIYKDPVLEHIRNDLRDSSHKAQKYQTAAGESDNKSNEYLERPEQTDRRKLPQKNIATEFEVHRPERRPIYYRRPPQNNHREHILNQRLRHPWNNIAKVTPTHYRPIKVYLHGLRQNHALKYDDERNEYPQLIQHEDSDEKPDGFDIYEKGKEKFLELNNYFDDTIGKTVLTNKNIESKEKENIDADDVTDEKEFVPIKNYAQVRKTETTKHLPKEAALHDAETLEEIQNAPRLREAIKSKKAQIVYSEEGYEDSAYDHAGEQKHASDHERHGGYLKENEISKGKFKTPSFNANYGDAKGYEHKNQILHGDKWKNDIKESEDESESDYYETDEEESDVDDSKDSKIINSENSRNKRNSKDVTDIILKRQIAEVNKTSADLLQHGIIKRETPIKISETLVTNDTDIKKKYPYYFKNLKVLSKHSPLRYAENFQLRPKKTGGGSEFYDSRSKVECPEVQDNVDPIPEKLKKDGHPDDQENGEKKKKEKDEFGHLKDKQRLHGLGDKIDCFKAKYFDENPLDNPFFQEGIIENPEPVTMPNLEIFNTKKDKQMDTKVIKYSSDINSVFDNQKKSKDMTKLTTKTRKKRATPFMYEPYKILRDGQIQDSKKTTTSSNISPLIKQLQSSRVIDKVTINQDKELLNKNKTSAKIYKDIGKGDRQGNLNSNSSDSFVDVSTDIRRGEPRYELRPANHKTQYTPVEYKRAMTTEEYKAQTARDTEEKYTNNTESTTHSQLKRLKRLKPTARPFFDVSKYLPQSLDTQSIAASNVVRNLIRTTTPATTTEEIQQQTTTNSDNNEEDDDEDDDDDDDDDDNDDSSKNILTSTTTTTTTTVKPAMKKRIVETTTTTKPIKNMKQSEPSKLRLVTSFRDFQPDEKLENYYSSTEPLENIYSKEYSSPRYTEKKRKSTKSTLVTDTKSYGNGDDDLVKEEVDKFIGAKQDMDEYIPLYERVVNKINKMKTEENNNRNEHKFDGGSKSHDDDDHYRFNDSDEDDDEDENDDEDDVDEDDDDDDEDSDNNDEGGNTNDNAKDNIHVDNSKKPVSAVTTSEPTKRTLARTTEAPATTTETRSAKLQLKPIILKKKIEIHKELPVDKSSPNITQFKHDIKEIEVIKEMPIKPRKKTNKSSEALHLYRDEKLAEEINKLGDVEVFKENLDLKSGPKHGGNYRHITKEELQKEKLQQHGSTKQDDVEASQTETRKQIKNIPLRRRGSYNRSSNPQMKSSELNAQFIELSDSYDTKPKSMHGGNLKLPQSRNDRRNNKSEKYIELDESDKEKPSDMHGGNFKSYGNVRNTGRQMHGGNYRSAKLINADDGKSSQTRRRTETTTKATLTTTPLFILDPSKRMYYYVDA